MPDEIPPPKEPGLPSRLGGLDPGELLARGMHSVKISSAGGAGWTPPSIDEVTHLFPNYQVTAMLGHGGMGAVYQARHIPLDRLVAIKLLPLEISGDQNFADRFRREARAMAKLNHPNILSVFDFGGTSEGHLYFIMEFVDGGSVHDLIHGDGPGLAPADALAIVGYVCDALAYAHAEGIVHRDVKPANVLIDRQGHVKVADFGLARLNEAMGDAGGRTMTGVIMGTPDYMAPEQKKGAHVDHRADIYAIGVMLYEMLCKETPQGAFEPVSKRCGIDKRIDAIVSKALAQQPEHRFQSTIEIKKAVETVRPSVLRAQSRHKAPASVVFPLGDSPSRSPFPTRWVFSAAVLILLGGTALWMAATGSFPDWHLSRPAPGGFSASKEPWRSAVLDASFLGSHEGVERSPAGGFLFQSKGLLTFADGPKRDGAVRLLVWFAPQIDELKVIARAGSSRYQGFLTEDGKGADCQLYDGASTGIDGILYSPLAAPIHAGELCELEMRMAGKNISLRVNGQIVAQGSDSTLESGDFGLLWRGSQPLAVKAVEYLNLGQPGGLPAAAPGKITHLSASTEAWRNALADPCFEDAQEGATRTDAGLIFQRKAGIAFASGPARDGAVRILAPFSPDLDSLKIVARKREKSYQAFAAGDGTGGDCQLFAGASTGIESIRYTPLATPLENGELCELEFRIVGKQLTVKLNGQVVAQGEDATLAEGSFGLLWQKDFPITIKAAEYLVLGGTQ